MPRSDVMGGKNKLESYYEKLNPSKAEEGKQRKRNKETKHF